MSGRPGSARAVRSATDRVEGVGNVLEVTGISKRFGSLQALDDVSFSAAAGEIVSLLGPNGAGKSTLVSTISGLIRPDAGGVVIDGVRLDQKGRRARSRLGVASQDIALVRTRSVRDNLRFFGTLAGARGKDLEQRIAGLIDDFALGGILDQKVLLLSGGEQRRAHVAAALVRRAQVLVVDEPTAGADLDSRAAILGRIARERDEGRTVLYTTHAMDEVAELGARVVIIDRGQVIVDTTVPELVAEHARATVEVRFVEPLPGLPVHVDAAIDGTLVRIATHEPGRAIAELLRVSDGAEVDSIEVIRPGLAAAFLSLTGRRFDADTAADTDDRGISVDDAEVA